MTEQPIKLRLWCYYNAHITHLNVTMDRNYKVKSIDEDFLSHWQKVNKNLRRKTWKKQ